MKAGCVLRNLLPFLLILSTASSAASQIVTLHCSGGAEVKTALPLSCENFVGSTDKLHLTEYVGKIGSDQVGDDTSQHPKDATDPLVTDKKGPSATGERPPSIGQIVNSDSAMSSDQKDSRTGGTVVVAVVLSDGVVLAADSRLTFVDGKTYRVISDHANKLFSIGRVGMAAYGESFLMNRSIGSYFEAFKDEILEKISKKDVPEAEINDVDHIARRFSDYFSKFYNEEKKMRRREPEIEFVFAGYDDMGVGRVVTFGYPKAPDPERIKYSTAAPTGISWWGQTDTIARLFEGFDPNIAQDELVANLDVPTRTELAKVLDKQQFLVPFQNLPLQDGIDLAMSLVQTTVDMQRFSFGTKRSPDKKEIPGVGGPVDIMYVTPTELTWVKQKVLTARQ